MHALLALGLGRSEGSSGACTPNTVAGTVGGQQGHALQYPDWDGPRAAGACTPTPGLGRPEGGRGMHFITGAGTPNTWGLPASRQHAQLF